jgi:hypothetical protein
MHVSVDCRDNYIGVSVLGLGILGYGAGVRVTGLGL